MRALAGSALVALLGTTAVLAQPGNDAPDPDVIDEIQVSLEFDAPPECGTQANLAERIAWRTRRVRFVDASVTERHLRVEIDVEDGASIATLTLTQPSGRRSARTLRAARCEQAVDAAALVAAVTLDPSASADPAPDTSAKPLDGTGGTAAAATTAAKPVTSARPPPPRDAGEGGETGETGETGESDGGGSAGPRDRTEFSGSGFALGQVLIAAAPRELVGLGVGTMVVWHRGSVVSPAARLSFAGFLPSEFTAIGGTATFELFAATLEVCPFRVGPDYLGAFLLCPSFTAGVLSAEGSETIGGVERSRPWLVVGGTPMLFQWRPIEPLEVQAFANLGHPLVRDWFQFDPEVFHKVPSPALSAGIAIGYFFR